MKKKLLFALLFFGLVAGAFAQTNWISLEIKGPGAGLRYEYVFTPRFTIGAYFSYTFVTIPINDYQMNSIEFGATARLYPFARRFFIDLSLGNNKFGYEEEIYVGSGWGWEYRDWEYREGSGMCIAPGFGWTIDVGKAGGFFLSPGAKFPITTGSRPNITIAPYLGLGVAF